MSKAKQDIAAFMLGAAIGLVISCMFGAALALVISWLG
jgi:hypothetical protein